MMSDCCSLTVSLCVCALCYVWLSSDHEAVFKRVLTLAKMGETENSLLAVLHHFMRIPQDHPKR